MYRKKQLLNLSFSLSSAFVMVFFIVNIGSLCQVFDPTTSNSKLEVGNLRKRQNELK